MGGQTTILDCPAARTAASFAGMRTFSRHFGAAVLAVVVWLGPSSARAQSSAEIPPVSCEHLTRPEPKESIYVVRINLRDPRVTARVARGGPPTNAPTYWPTSLRPTSEIAAREHFDVAINGDFFDAQNTKDKEGRKTGYIRGKAATPVGTAMTDGELWHRPTAIRPVLELLNGGRARLAELGPATPVDAEARQIMGGGQIILRGGQWVPSNAKFTNQRHPRTAVGLDASGTQLTLVVVDGRRTNYSVGMTLPELAEQMKQLHCDSAINLDGGGSSTLVYRAGSAGKLKVLNSPSDTKERSVADVLGFVVAAPLPEPR